MKEIFKLSKREKKIVKEVLETELKKVYTDDEAEVIMNEVLQARDKVQEAFELMERAELEYKTISTKFGIEIKKTPKWCFEYEKRRKVRKVALGRIDDSLILAPFVCGVKKNGANFYNDDYLIEFKSLLMMETERVKMFFKNLADEIVEAHEKYKVGVISEKEFGEIYIKEWVEKPKPFMPNRRV